MGNTSTASNKVPDAASGAYSPSPRDEHVYGESFYAPASSRYSTVSGTYGHSSLGSSATLPATSTPPIPPRVGGGGGLERRSMTVVARERPADSPVE